MTSLAREFQLSVVQARAAFALVREVVSVDGPPSARGEHLLEVAGGTLELPEAARWDASPSDAEAQRLFATPEARRVLIHALVAAACIDGVVTPNGERAVQAWARALGVVSPWVALLPALRRRATFAVKRELFRRSPDARRLFARTWAEEGLLGVWRVVLFVLGAYRAPALAAKFRALEALPVGTVGRTFFDDFRARGLAFPGERGGLPERMLHHDLMHVINRFGTDPAGECELAGFYAGFTTGDPFTFLMTVLTTFHLGMPVSPSIVTPARLALDPARVVAGFLRGRRLRVDVMGPWDYWSVMGLALDDAQALLGVGEAVATRAPSS